MPRKLEPFINSSQQATSSRLIIVTHHLPWECQVQNVTSPSTSPYSSLPLAISKKFQLKSPTDSTRIIRDEPPVVHLHQRKGHSALFSGIRSLLSHSQILHIGFTGALLDQNKNPIESNDLLFDSCIQDMLTTSLSSKHCIPIFYPDELASGHYEGYCKTILWPIFHYQIWDNALNGTDESKYWAAYVTINQYFADSIVRHYQSGDTIWIHDYHLLLVPSMVRKKLPNATIGFFLHTPFPSSELFRCLPKRKEILSGILGSNLIGFQTYSYARHFISSCTRVLGCESSPKGVDFHGSTICIGIFPIGIDVQRALTKRCSLAVQEKISAIKNMYAGKHIIFGRDKMDHIKGIQHKLSAFEKFLSLFPEFQHKVVLIQVTEPGMNNSKLESKLSELVSRINGNYGSLEFVPVHHYHQHLDVDDYFALLSTADIGLITSTRDGMNTTSHEYVICQDGNHGSLILSEFTGTAGSLSAAILVNPWDYVGVAHAIYDALTMSKEEKWMKHQALYQHVNSHTSDFWASSFVKQLLSTETVQQQSNPTPFLDSKLFLEKYKKSSKRLFMFDYDGTLTAIRKTPNAAVPSEKMLKGLEKLVNHSSNYVFVVSGRDQAFLDEHLGHLSGLGLSAEHGCFIKYPHSQKWINLSAEFDLTWKNEVAEIFGYYTERTQGSFIEHKRCSITWHYRLADPEYGQFQAKECQNHLENAIQSKLPVEVMLGKKNIEVRPVAINKGEIVKRVLTSRQPGVDFVFCIGDDRTDEDMFKALRKSDMCESEYFTCTIGPGTKKTNAQWHVTSPDDVIELLHLLADVE